MRALAPGIALLALPALASAEPTAEVRAGVAVIGMETAPGVAPDGLSMVPGYSAAGILAGTASGEVFLSRQGGAAVGFAFAYQRSRTFKSVTEESGAGEEEFDTLYADGALGAVARVRLRGDVAAVGRVAVGRSRLSFEPRADSSEIAELPASEYRYLRLGGGVEQQFGTIGLGVGAGFSSAYSIAGAAADVMGETRGLVVDARLSASLALGPSLEIVTTAAGSVLAAGSWRETHFGIDVGLGVRM